MVHPYKICPRCQTSANLQSPKCEKCGRVYNTKFVSSDVTKTFDQPAVLLPNMLLPPPVPKLKPAQASLIGLFMVAIILPAVWGVLSLQSALRGSNSDLELLDDRNGGSGIVGHVRNNSNHTYSYAQVEINLYDRQNNQVGSTLSNVNNFEPGKIWQFDAPIFQVGASKYKIKNVSGW